VIIVGLADKADKDLVSIGQDAELRVLQLMWVDVLLELSAPSCQPDVRVAAQATLLAVGSFLACVERSLLFGYGYNGGKPSERFGQVLDAQQAFNTAATIRRVAAWCGATKCLPAPSWDGVRQKHVSATAIPDHGSRH
jgi:hypothetical protein